MPRKANYQWKKQTRADKCEAIACPAYDAYMNFKRDPTGFYVLIKINFEVQRIEVAICDKRHKIQKIFYGQRAQDLYHAIFEYEKKNGEAWFQEKTHMAYLGKELKKAEMSLALGNQGYYQE